MKQDKTKTACTQPSMVSKEASKPDRIDWLKRNKEAIEAANALVTTCGLFADNYSRHLIAQKQ